VKRIFIAIRTEPLGDLTRMISTARSMLGAERIRWVDPVNMHITLAFLGDTAEKRIGKVSSVIEEACKDYGIFEFNLSGMGVFKNINDPRVIWVGIDPKEKLEALSNRIIESLRFDDFQPERRGFNPHLTIGRINRLNDRDALKRLLASHETTEFQKVEAREVILFESILMQTGPLYKPLGKFSL
jgi:2'-5' RNA ligase